MWLIITCHGCSVVFNSEEVVTWGTVAYNYNNLLRNCQEPGWSWNEEIVGTLGGRRDLSWSSSLSGKLCTTLIKHLAKEYMLPLAKWFCTIDRMHVYDRVRLINGMVYYGQEGHHQQTLGLQMAFTSQRETHIVALSWGIPGGIRGYNI